MTKNTKADPVPVEWPDAHEDAAAMRRLVHINKRERAKRRRIRKGKG